MASFGAQLQAFADKTGKKLEEVDRSFKLELFDRVVRRTPVDTGRLKGNWQVSTGAPAQGELQRFARNGDQKIQPQVGLNPQEAAQIRPFSETWLVNNLPYARPIEERYGMLVAGIADALRRLEDEVRKVQ